MQKEIIDFVHGLSESIIHGLNIRKCEIEEDIEKLKIKLFIITTSIFIFITGIFATIWGISLYIDHMFETHGIGFVLVGIGAMFIGMFMSRRQD